MTGIHDFKLGDRVGFHAEGTVEALDTYDWLVVVKFDGMNYSIPFEGNDVLALNRIVPPIPTTPGTLIKHRETGNLAVKRPCDWYAIDGRNTFNIEMTALIDAEPNPDDWDILYTPDESE